MRRHTSYFNIYAVYDRKTQQKYVAPTYPLLRHHSLLAGPKKHINNLIFLMMTVAYYLASNENYCKMRSSRTATKRKKKSRK